ncbi:MAG: hypothetical protein CML33_04410 [Rhodobacteraceae bacterium]|nr:hypothetical protein [Paracoccaceae bacterium]
MMSPPIKIAAGVTILMGVCVICLMLYLAATAPSVDTPDEIAKTSTQAEPAAKITSVINNEILAQTAQKAPVFDLVRVDDSGSAVIAGQAEPGTDVAITMGGKAFETVQSDRKGAFVALVQLPSLEEVQTIGLQQLRDGAVVAVSGESVLILSPALEAELVSVPTIVLADETGAEVLQGGARTVVVEVLDNPLTLDTISYDNSGAVVLSGQGTGAQFVRVYMDNEPIITELIGDDGSWRAVLSDVDEGVSTLRVDEINTEGNVQARVESLFQRAAVKDLLAGGVTSTDTGRVVVQPGHTLWELAENTYGDGVKYVKIFHANRNAIRDADLIYPGQIFELPE